ncbi:MAG: AlpA family phage regulatory protein [Candidatus Obscuribacterales bacterium]|nr:AlpA family phage regulatory protein [Candidatus Obscuribacterales bacterium]
MKSFKKFPRQTHRVTNEGRADYPELQELIRHCRETNNVCVLRLPQVKAKTGLANSTIWKATLEGTLPPPLSIGTKSVGWLDSELNAVIAARLFAARSGQQVDIKAFVTQLISSNNPARKTGFSFSQNMVKEN